MITSLTLMLLGQLSATGAPADPGLEATVAVGWVAAQEELAIRAPGVSAQETRTLSTYQLSLGVAARQLALSELLDLQLAAWLGFGFRPGPGDPIVSAAGEVLWRALEFGWFSLGLGLRSQLWVDTAELSASGVGFGLPVALRLGSVELLYTLGVAVPLGKEERPVLGGVAEQGLALGLVPFDLALRFYFDAAPER